jgi:L-ascorbate metabolism protein UlaG (beta-lactamase superfamily)
MKNTIQYIGHSAFYINTNTNGILIDPFISQNPSAVFNTNNKISDIFVTHGHADHLGDAIPLSKQHNAPITTIFELANYCARNNAIANPINFGGKINYEWGNAIFLPAFHSNSSPDGQYAGMPASILFEINGTKIYHAGDTCLNTEMKMIGELYSPDIALLPIGSVYTMDIDHAVLAAKWLNAKKVIPMHYNTFGAINVNIKEFEEKIKSQNIQPIILKSGEETIF